MIAVPLKVFKPRKSVEAIQPAVERNVILCFAATGECHSKSTGIVFVALSRRQCIVIKVERPTGTVFLVCKIMGRRIVGLLRAQPLIWAWSL